MKQLGLPFPPEYIEIPLSKTGKHAGKYTAIVSLEDADLAEYNWGVIIGTGDLRYAARNPRKQGYTPMHRVILERILGRKLRKGELCDHKNCNSLDNRRENLRLATHQENMRNRRVSRSSGTGVKGVTKVSRTTYAANIHYGGKNIYIGIFATIEEAHKAYCDKADELFGEFANHSKTD